MIAKLTTFSKPIVIVTALALLVDLMLHWRDAPVRSQWINVDAATSALHGLGMVAALLVIAFLAVEIFLRRPPISLAVAVAAAGFTVAAFFTGSAGVVEVDGAILAADAESTLWPAFAGLGLAAGLVIAAVLRLLQPPPTMHPLPPLPSAYRDVDRA